MSEIRIDSDLLNEVASLLSLWYSRGATYRNHLATLIGFKRDDPTSDFAVQFQRYLTTKQAPNPERSDHRGAWDSTQGDELPDSMKEDKPLETWLKNGDPMAIWEAGKAGTQTTKPWAAFLRDSGWDCIDHRNVKSPLLMAPEKVRELLNEQVIDDRNYIDQPVALRGLLELIMKAFMNWWETNKATNGQPKLKKFGEL